MLFNSEPVMFADGNNIFFFQLLVILWYWFLSRSYSFFSYICSILENIINQHDVKYICYADDIQLYIFVSPDNPVAPSECSLTENYTTVWKQERLQSTVVRLNR